MPAVRALGTYVVGLINPFTLTAAAAAALGYAFYAGNKEAKEFNNTLVLTSNYAGQTATSFQALASQVAVDTTSSFGDARDVLLDLTKTGRYTSGEMEGLANVIIRTSRMTGESLENVSKDYAKLAEDPAKWAAEHNQSMHFMDVATYQHITALQEAGDKHAAIQAVIEAATAQVANASVKNLSVAGQAWRDLTQTVSRFWEETKKGLSTGPTLQDRIDTLMGERGGIQHNPLASGRVAQIDQQVALLQEQQRMEQRAAETSAANARRQEAAISAQQRIDKMADTVMSNAQRRQKELEKLQKDRQDILAAGGKFSDEDYANLVAGINSKYKDPKVAKPKKEKAYQDDAATRFLQQLRDQDAATRAALDSSEKLTGAEKQQAEFLQKIADLKGKDILTADQKSLLANQDAIKVQLAQNVEHEKALKYKEEIAKLEERSAAVNAQIGNYQKSQAEQYQRQLDAMGRGSDAQRQAEQVKSIYTQYQNLQLQLEKATPEAARGSEAYLKAQQDIRDGLDKSLQDYDTYYATLKEKQADWVNGATEAMANYADSSRNAMAQASNAATNAFKRMEDGIVAFATTGKFNFGDFAQAVIADLIRIQARAALSGLFSQLGGLIMGAAGGAAGADTGTPIHGVTVRLVERNVSTITEDGGSYVFADVPPGRYTVVARMDGFRDSAEAITLAAGATETVNFVLRLLGPREEITVTATGHEESTFESFQTVSSLDSVQLAEEAHTSLGEVMESQPGVAKRSFGPGAARPVIRGFDGDRILVLQDGARTGALSSQSGDHGETVDVLGLEKLEVVKGPATLLYGSNAAGGVVNVIDGRIPTERPAARYEGAARLAYGSNADERTGAAAVTAALGGTPLVAQIGRAHV